MINFIIGFISIILISGILMYYLKNSTTKKTKENKKKTKDTGSTEAKAQHSHDHDTNGEDFNWFFWFLGLIFVIYVYIHFGSAIINFFSTKESIKAYQPQSESRWVDSVYTLRKGDTVMVEIPPGVTIDYYSGGTAEHPHRYFHKSQNGDWEIWGDGTYHQAVVSSYVEMTAYDKEVKILCKRTN